MRRLLFCFIFFSTVCFASPAQDIYAFPSQQQQLQFTELTQKLRCLVCQNETLADSNAPLAKDLRNDIVQMILQKKSNQEIIAYLVNRYGDFVMYQPPLTSNTLILWFAPLLLLMLGLVIVATVIWHRQHLAKNLS